MKWNVFIWENPENVDTQDADRVETIIAPTEEAAYEEAARLFPDEPMIQIDPAD